MNFPKKKIFFSDSQSVSKKITRDLYHTNWTDLDFTQFMDLEFVIFGGFGWPGFVVRFW